MNDSILPTEEKTVVSIKSEEELESQAKDNDYIKNLPTDKVLALAENLKVYKSFSYARRILEKTADRPELNIDLPDLTADRPELNEAEKLKLKFYQQFALCTYKDTDLPLDSRLDEALKILEKLGNLNTTREQETLGIIGAIYKRKWEVDSQKMQLERSLLYYRRGYSEGVENDFGYTGINAAFVLDWLAFQEEEEARTANIESLTATARREKAREIRQNIVNEVTPLINKPENRWLETSWWYYGTLAEAYFGLKDYEKAVEWIEKGKEKIGKIPEWEEESTLQQLARLAIFQSDASRAGSEFEGTPAYNMLLKAFPEHKAAILNAFTGKIGLALSGGGFRASLYHIGTLAKLAELGILQHVEVLSCVSGGSIIGAHYYLKVRELLKKNPDGTISREHYIKIVEEIVDEFLKGVQRNIRVRMASEFRTNLKMILSRNYSRTKRAGELYEKEIFSKVPDGEGSKPRYMSELNIYPKDDVEKFNPKLHNWRRGAKVPILILNSATLNTGHNWQFTTTWMGESPANINTAVDTNDRLRRMYYPEAPEAHRKIRLGDAVSASAGVPGLFDPLTLENLYPERIIRLVDGGVGDNQGITSLLEQDCNVVLVSDGSGQMVSEKEPSNSLIKVLWRSYHIFEARVRDVQYRDLERRRRSSLLRGLMFIHLKEDLAADPIDWVECPDPGKKSEETFVTNFNISKEVQLNLAAIRTDLDSFTEIEAYSLMTSAYRMTEHAFKNKKCISGFSDSGYVKKWKFLDIEEHLHPQSRNYQHINKLLSTGGSTVFKVWKQVPLLKYSAIMFALLLAVLIVWLFISKSDYNLLNVSMTLGELGKWLIGIALSLIATLILGIFAHLIYWRSTMMRIVFGMGMCFFGWIIALIHLRVFDEIFLSRGKLKSLPHK